MKHIVLPCGDYGLPYTYFFMWNFHGLLQNQASKFELFLEKIDISVVVPLFHSVFSGIYRPLIYVCIICMTSV